ncbi:hypothetical protein HX049_18125 [Myroides odoratimimus]|uniref:hypothetical protein n=1 Tax=Myroides odoratimimus TaxID=76832 RepID=UPI002578394E|nr:hypothetical protein [Myroides odoratimimus]MDM1399047.1 hypothetical protein [Myroides odoratimimus]
MKNKYYKLGDEVFLKLHNKEVTKILILKTYFSISIENDCSDFEKEYLKKEKEVQEITEKEFNTLYKRIINKLINRL